MEMFFNHPSSRDLKLYIPGYAYFQGIVYSKGDIKAMGPIRIIGGVVVNTPDEETEMKEISLQKGAMLTTDQEYLKKKMSRSQTKLKVVTWEEVPVKLKEVDK